MNRYEFDPTPRGTNWMIALILFSMCFGTALMTVLLLVLLGALL
jgi:hypothetical protein